MLRHPVLGGETVDALFTAIGDWLASLGPSAYLFAPLVMAAVAVLPVPAEAPAMVNGMLFGPLVGSFVTWSGAMLGAWISYEIALVWGRPVARRVVSPTALARVDGLAEGVGWWGLIVLRLIPAVAFTALNWGAGLCGIPRRRFLWTTALGIVPGAVLFTYSGVGLGALYARSPLAAAGLAALILVGVLYWWIARRGRGAGVAAGPTSPRGGEGESV